MKRFHVFLLGGFFILMLLPGVSRAQVSILWNHWIGYTTDDFVSATVVDKAGDVYVTGSYWGSYLTVKYQGQTGDILWSMSYGSNGASAARAIAIDSQGDVYVTGECEHVDGFGYHWTYCITVKYRGSDGTQLWDAEYNPLVSYEGKAGGQAVTVDSQGNVYVAGSIQVSSYENYEFLVRYTGSGSKVWDKSLDVGNPHQVHAIAVDGAGDVIVAGRAGIRKWRGSDGQYLWGKWDPRIARAVAVDAGNNIYVTGTSSSDVYSPYNHIVTAKYDAGGVQKWSQLYDGPAADSDIGVDIGLDGRGGVFVTGHTAVTRTDVYPFGYIISDYVTFKYRDTDGAQLWSKRYNGGTNYEDRACALTVDSAGNLYVTGYSGPVSVSYWYTTLKYRGSTGEVLWQVGTPSGYDDEPCGIEVSGSGNVYVSGYTSTVDHDPYTGELIRHTDWYTIAYAQTGTVATSLTAADVTGAQGQSVTLSATLKKTSDGTPLSGKTITFQVDGNTVGPGTTNSSGVATKSYDIPPTMSVGKHTITAAFDGDSTYKQSSDTGDLTVKVGTVVTVANVSGVPGQAVTLSATLKRISDNAPLGSKTLTFKVGTWSGTAVTNTSGIATKSYTIPSTTTAGDYPITVTFAGDGTYGDSKGTGTLTVAKRATTLTASDTAGAIGQTVNLSATLKRTSDGVPLASKTLTFQVGTWSGTAVTNTSGLATKSCKIPEGVGVGPEQILVTFKGDTAYKESADTATLTVTRANTSITVTDVTGTIGASVTLKATLKCTTDNAALSGKTITFQVDGVTVGSGTTSTSGVATKSYLIPAGMSTGAHTVKATFPNETLYNGSSDTGTLTARAGTKITVPSVTGQRGQTVSLKATLTRASNGALLSGKTLTFKVDSTVLGTAVTNTSGVATRSYLIPSTAALGAHTITVSFAGDTTTYAPSTGTGKLYVKVATTLTVANVTGAIGQTVSLSATLRQTLSLAPLSGRTLTFKVGTTTVGTAVTNTSGIATKSYKVSSALGIGPEPITVTFTGDTYALPGSGTGTLTVSKANTSVTVTNLSGRTGQTVYLKATLKRTTDGSVLASKTLTFKVGTWSGTAVTNTSGVASKAFLIPVVLGKGAKTISVTFTADTLYNGSSGSGILTVY